MKVEYDKKNNRKSTKKEVKRKRRRRLKPAFFIMLALFLVAIAAVLSLTVFFEIESVNVSGESIYSQEMVINAAGIKNGQNLLRLNKNKISDKIEKGLPYVKDAVVTKVFPNSVSIRIVPATEFAVMEIDGQLVTIDENFKALSIESERREDLAFIKGVKASNVVLGEIVTITDKEQQTVLNELLKFAKASELRVTAFDITNTVSVSALLEDRILVQFGSRNYFENKINHLKAMLPTVIADKQAKIFLDTWTTENKKTSIIYEEITQHIAEIYEFSEKNN